MAIDKNEFRKLYLGGLTPDAAALVLESVDEVATRVVAAQTDLSGGATLANVITAINSLYAAMRAAGLMAE